MTEPNGHEIGHGRGCHVARPMLAADVARRVLTWIRWRSSLTQRHVSRCDLPTCRALNGPCVALWFVHVSHSALSTCRAQVCPRVTLWFVHVSGSEWSTCRNQVCPRVSLRFVHVSRSGLSTCRAQVHPRYEWEVPQDLVWNTPVTISIFPSRFTTYWAYF
jgi:hypothetical protein